MTGAEFYINRLANVVRFWITAERARKVYDEHKDDQHFSGTLETGFEYWLPGPENSGIDQLVFVSVMPLPTLLVPQSVRDQLAAGIPNVLAS